MLILKVKLEASAIITQLQDEEANKLRQGNRNQWFQCFQRVQLIHREIVTKTSITNLNKVAETVVVVEQIVVKCSIYL